MKKLRTSAAEATKWLLILAVIYSGATQPLYLIVPKTAQQIEACLAQQQICVTACAAPTGYAESRGCATVPCEAVTPSRCPVDDSDSRPSKERCCSLIATQPGVEGLRLSLDNGASHDFGLLPAAVIFDIPLFVGTVHDHTIPYLSSSPVSPPPTRAPPLG